MKQSFIIAVDFDGTVVEHRFHKIGKDVPDAVRVLKRLVSAKHKIMLWTMRSSMGKHQLADGTFHESTTLIDVAIQWFKERHIPLYSVNTNPEQDWSSSHKQYANFYIDDTAVGCPLIYPDHYSVASFNQNSEHNRPYVDWLAIETYLEKMGVLKEF